MKVITYVYPPIRTGSNPNGAILKPENSVLNVQVSTSFSMCILFAIWYLREPFEIPLPISIGKGKPKMGSSINPNATVIHYVRLF